MKLFGSLEKPSKSQCRWCCTLHVPVSAVKVKRWIKNYTLSATYSTKNLTILRYYLLFCTHTCSLKQNFELLKPHPDIFFFFSNQGSQICQNCSDESTEVTERVTWTSEIFGNKQGATFTPQIFGNTHSFVLTFFATNTMYLYFKCCKP